VSISATHFTYSQHANFVGAFQMKCLLSDPIPQETTVMTNYVRVLDHPTHTNLIFETESCCCNSISWALSMLCMKYVTLKPSHNLSLFPFPKKLSTKCQPQRDRNRCRYGSHSLVSSLEFDTHIICFVLRSWCIQPLPDELGRWFL
jgi:hypothetical protein